MWYVVPQATHAGIPHATALQCGVGERAGGSSQEILGSEKPMPKKSGMVTSRVKVR